MSKIFGINFSIGAFCFNYKAKFDLRQIERLADCQIYQRGVGGFTPRQRERRTVIHSTNLNFVTSIVFFL